MIQKSVFDSTKLIYEFRKTTNKKIYHESHKLEV